MNVDLAIHELASPLRELDPLAVAMAITCIQERVRQHRKIMRRLKPALRILDRCLSDELTIDEAIKTCQSANLDVVQPLKLLTAYWTSTTEPEEALDAFVADQLAEADAAAAAAEAAASLRA